jgi:NADH-quinone oxidoreductase subunit N
MTYTISQFLFESIGAWPELFLTFACLSELMLTLFTVSTPHHSLVARAVTRRVAFYLVCAIIFMLFNLNYQTAAAQHLIFWAGAFQLTLPLVYTKVAMAGLAVFILVTANPYLAHYRLNNYEFGILMGLAVVAMFCVVSAYNLMVLYLALELQALIFFILLAWRRRSRWSLDSTLKYVLVNLVASVFFLLAINRAFALVHSVSYPALANYSLLLLKAYLPEADRGLLFYPELYSEMMQTYVMSSGVITSGWWLVLTALLIAFSLKLGVAPFHLWVLSVYEHGVAPVIGLITTASKISYVAAVSVLLTQIFYPILIFWQWFFALVALISIFWGNLALLYQNNLLRVIGSSSISSGGYLYLIWGFAPQELLFPLALMYMVLSALLYCNWFLVLNTTFLATASGSTVGAEQSVRTVSDLATLRYSSGHKGWALILALNLCSLAGVPPLVGFWVKFLTYTAFMKAGVPDAGAMFYLLLIMLATLIGAAAYLRILYSIYFEIPNGIRSYLPNSVLYSILNYALFVFNWSIPVIWAMWDQDLLNWFWLPLSF